MTTRKIRVLGPSAALVLALAGAAALAQQPPHAGGPPAGAQGQPAQRYPGQFAQDWQAGRVPTDEEIAGLEREMAGKPEDPASVRRLGKAYFFRYFGDGREEAIPRARALFGRALEIDPKDAEILAYLGSLDVLEASRGRAGDATKARYDEGLARLERAQELAPDHGAVLSVVGATYLMFPDSYGTAPRAAAAMERIRRGMGPAFARFSHHGQQRVLLTQGAAYAKMGRIEEARACFEQGLAVNPDSIEGAMLKGALLSLPEKPAGK